MNGKYFSSPEFIFLSAPTRRTELTHTSRPISSNAEWEASTNPDLPFDYDAVPSTFYFDVESVGNLEPDTIVQQGINVLQRKLAEVINALTGGAGGGGGGGAAHAGMAEIEGDGDRSPDAYEPPEGLPGDGGFSAYAANAAQAVAGNGSVWGGMSTAYGQTPLS